MLLKEEKGGEEKQPEPIHRPHMIKPRRNGAWTILACGAAFIDFCIGIYISAHLVHGMMTGSWEDNYDVSETAFVLLIVCRISCMFISLYPIYPAMVGYEQHAARKWAHVIFVCVYIVLTAIGCGWTFVAATDTLFIFFGAVAFMAAFLVYACGESHGQNSYTSSWLA